MCLREPWCTVRLHMNGKYSMITFHRFLACLFVQTHRHYVWGRAHEARLEQQHEATYMKFIIVNTTKDNTSQ